jgi:hypothetical protein
MPMVFIGAFSLKAGEKDYYSIQVLVLKPTLLNLKDNLLIFSGVKNQKWNRHCFVPTHDVL